MDKYFILTILLVSHFMSASAQNYSLVPFSSDGGKRWGMMNLQSKIVIPAHYDSIGFLEGNLGIVVKQKGKYGMINSLGDEIIKPKYISLKDTCDFVILKEKEDVMYHYDKKLHVIMPFTQEIYGLMHCNYEEILDGGYSYQKPNLDKLSAAKNFFIIHNQTDTTRINRNAFISDIMDEYLCIIYTKKQKYGAIIGHFSILKQDERNVWGRWNTDTLLAVYDTLYPNYSGCRNFSTHFKESCRDRVDVLIAKKDGKWGIISPQNNFLTGFKYEAIERWAKSSAKTASKYVFVKENGLWGWLSTQTFQPIGECKYQDIKRVPTRVADLFFKFRYPNGKIGYTISQNGKEIIE